MYAQAQACARVSIFQNVVPDLGSHSYRPARLCCKSSNTFVSVADDGAYGRNLAAGFWRDPLSNEGLILCAGPWLRNCRVHAISTFHPRSLDPFLVFSTLHSLCMPEMLLGVCDQL